MANPPRSKAINPVPPVKKWSLAKKILTTIAVVYMVIMVIILIVIMLNLRGIIHLYPDSGNSNVDTSVKTPDGSTDNILQVKDTADVDTAVQTPDASTDNIVPVSNPSELPSSPTTNAAVTIDNASCAIRSNVYLGSGQSLYCKEGWKFASSYNIIVSGSMTGPVGASFYMDSAKISARDSQIFSCGGWAKDDYSIRCIRQADSSLETAYWSLTRNNVAGEIVHLSPNLSPVIYVEVKDRNSIYGKVLANATYVLACPTVDYCAGI